jgi:hypothetical protein
MVVVVMMIMIMRLAGHVTGVWDRSACQILVRRPEGKREI